jgi:predicted ATPase
MRAALARHDEIVRSSIDSHRGWVFATGGDGFAAAFHRVGDGLGAALEAQQRLGGERWPEGCVLRVRMGLHTGEVDERDGNYFGSAVNRAARVMAVAHGGQTVMSQAVADLAIESGSKGVSLRDLGVHRLKDLSRPERIFQMGHPNLAGEFPLLRSLDARAHNLPVQRTSFIGRLGEVEAVKGLLIEKSLVSLVGSGGCGKTRLAVQAAADVLDEFPDGAWLADLAAVADPDGVASQVAQVFALKEGPGMITADAVAAYLGDKRALLILDNCEHVLEAAAALADRLVSSCPSLCILATSRQPLDLPGEVAWRVPSLRVPEGRHSDAGPAAIADLAACEAVQLFVERATSVRSGFVLTEANSQAVADICRRLDGIPLAIELAAARVRVFTPAQIASGLDQRFALLTGAPRTALPRQQTLEASVDWSHELLSASEQAVFRRLAVFAGSFDYEAAVAVCATPPIGAHQVLDQLSSLVDKSLVLVDDSGEQARYRLLETVREYAARRLAMSGEDNNARTAHRNHYLAFAEAAQPHLEGPGQTEWMDAVAADYPNLLAALSWSQARIEDEQLSRIAVAVHVYWGIHGPNTEGVTWLDHALEVGRGLRPLLRAEALFARSQLAGWNFDLVNLGPRAQEGLETARELGDDRLTARFLTLLAQAGMLMGQRDGTVDEAEELARKVGDPWSLAGSLLVQGGLRVFDNPTSARGYYEEACRVAATAGNLAWAHLSAGFVCSTLVLSGRPLEGRALCDQVAAETDSGDRMTLAMTLMYSATALADADERAEALGYGHRLERAAAELDMQLWKTYVAHIRSLIALADGDGEAAIRLGREAADLANNPLTRAEMLPALVEAELALARLPDADSHLDELEAIGLFGCRYFLAWAHVLRARRLRIAGESATARSTAHEGLSLAIDIEAKARIVDALEVLAGVAVDPGDHLQAARLFGSAQLIRDDTGYRRCVSERNADIDALRGMLGDSAFQAAYDQGRSTSLDDCIDNLWGGR